MRAVAFATWGFQNYAGAAPHPRTHLCEICQTSRRMVVAARTQSEASFLARAPRLDDASSSQKARQRHL